MTYIYKCFFPSQNGGGWGLFWLLLFNGIGLAYCGLLLTDQFFTSLLYFGIACGFFAIRNLLWYALLAHIVVIGFASQVRPTLGLFFLADLFLLSFISSIWQQSNSKRCKIFIGVMVMATAIVRSGPSIRNYVNHGVFSPGNVFADSLATYLAGPVMRSAGRGGEYYEKQKLFEQLEFDQKNAAK